MQDPYVQEHLKSADDVYNYIANFFEHRCGNHSGCLSAKCKNLDEVKDPLLTDEFIQQVQEIKRRYLKKLMKYLMHPNITD